VSAAARLSQRKIEGLCRLAETVVDRITSHSNHAFRQAKNQGS